MPKVYENDDDDEDIEMSLLKYDFSPCWCFLSLDNETILQSASFLVFY